MKKPWLKSVVVTVLAVLLGASLTGCKTELSTVFCNHDWARSTCLAPRTCKRCGLTEGKIRSHEWGNTDCSVQEGCIVCGTTEGDPITTDPRFTTEATAAVQGKWVSLMEITGEMIGEPGFDGTILFAFTMELNNDGTMAMYVQMEDVSALKDYLLDALYKEFEAQGLDKATADAAMKQSTGMTMEQYVDYALGMIDFNELLGSANIEGVYYVADGMIYSGNSWNSELTGEKFTLDGDTLTLETNVDGEATTMVFTRVTDGE